MTTNHTIPEGWKLVPVEPTEAMLAIKVAQDDGRVVYDYGETGILRRARQDIWRAMLSASPPPPEPAPDPSPQGELEGLRGALEHVDLMLAHPNTHFHYSTGRDAVAKLRQALSAPPTAHWTRDELARLYYRETQIAGAHSVLADALANQGPQDRIGADAAYAKADAFLATLPAHGVEPLVVALGGLISAVQVFEGSAGRRSWYFAPGFATKYDEAMGALASAQKGTP